MELYSWKSSGADENLLIAVLGYSYATANPARCRRALAKVLLLSNAADRILDSFDKMPNAFTMFTSIKFLDVDGSGAEKMMIGADTAGAGFIGVNSGVFGVSSESCITLTSPVRSL